MTSQIDLYHAMEARAGCDSLNQLAAFPRGTMSDANGDGIPNRLSSPRRSQSWTPDGQGNFTTMTTNGVGCFSSRSGVPPLGLISPGMGHWPNRTVFPGSREVTREPFAKAKRRDAASTENRIATISRPSRFKSWTPDGQGNFTTVTTNGLGETRTYDKQNQATALIDASGNVVERYVYDPYGKVTILSPDGSTVRTTSSYGWSYLHQGGRQDTATGLLNFRNRDYSTSLMRWTSNDPIGFAGGDTNTYRYVANGPGNGLDPSGLKQDPNRPMDQGPNTPPAEDGPGPVPMRKPLEPANQPGDPVPVGTKPGLVESLVPVWGSSLESYYYFQNGQYGWGVVYGGLAVTDVFMVKAACPLLIKGISKSGAYFLGSEVAKNGADQAPKVADRILLIFGKSPSCYFSEGQRIARDTSLPVLRQLFSNNFGPACIEMLIGGKNGGLLKIPEGFRWLLTRGGMTAAGLVEHLARLGFKAEWSDKWAKLGLNYLGQLIKANGPVIVLLQGKQNHWVIVDQIHFLTKHVWVAIRDPGIGKAYLIEASEFLEKFSGIGVYLKP